MKDLTKKNILKLKQSSTLVINEKCKKLINQGKKVYQFGFGQSPFPVPEKIVTALKNNAHRKEYLPIQGLRKLRESISKDLKKKQESIIRRRILLLPQDRKRLCFFYMLHLMVKLFFQHLVGYLTNLKQLLVEIKFIG